MIELSKMALVNKRAAYVSIPAMDKYREIGKECPRLQHQLKRIKHLSIPSLLGWVIKGMDVIDAVVMTDESLMIFKKGVIANLDCVWAPPYARQWEWLNRPEQGDILRRLCTYQNMVHVYLKKYVSETKKPYLHGFGGMPVYMAHPMAIAMCQTLATLVGDEHMCYVNSLRVELHEFNGDFTSDVNIVNRSILM
ncbi:MAG: hypothetical protein JKY09_08165 [Crocinitomicaceae bacterium]|nr:hypothetical protein [Crocinitomicaceae bacterium]